MTTVDTIVADGRKKMRTSIDAFKKEITTLRTGRANSALLEGLMVEYYGSMMPINQMGNISVPDGSLLVITPFDKTAIKSIEVAIQKSDLGLNPGSDGNVVRIPIPPLTEERRKELVKTLHRLSEDFKTAIRNIRRDTNDEIKKIEKNKDVGLSEDVVKKTMDDIQKMTDGCIKELEEIVKHKEAEILKI